MQSVKSGKAACLNDKSGAIKLGLPILEEMALHAFSIVTSAVPHRHHNDRYDVLNHRLSIVCSNGCSGADQRKHQSSASLAFVKGIHRWPVNSPHKGPVTRKMFSFDDVIMWHNISPHVTTNTNTRSIYHASTSITGGCRQKMFWDSVV